MEPIYKDLVIETEAKMEILLRWLLFYAGSLRAKSLNGYDLACTQTGRHKAVTIGIVSCGSFILKGLIPTTKR